MRGKDERREGLFSYVGLEQRIPEDHPLRAIRGLVDAVLRDLSRSFAKLYSRDGRPSIAPERLLRALLLQAFYTVRSERRLVEQLDYNLSLSLVRRGRRGRSGVGADRVHEEPRSVA